MQKEKLSPPAPSFIEFMDDHPELWDSQVSISDGTATLEDALNRKNEDGSRTSIVVLRQEGKKIELPTEEFLALGEKVVDLFNTSSSNNPDSNEGNESVTNHYQELFKPLSLGKETEPENEDNYSDLFKDKPDLTDPDKFEEFSKQAVQDARVDVDSAQKYINEESKKDSVICLQSARKVDPKLNAIITRYELEHNLTKPDDIVDVIRLDPKLRLEIGLYFVDKLDKLIRLDAAKIPGRVISNNSKKPDSGLWAGVKLNSREYVILLALSKIDGSFSKKMVQDQIDSSVEKIPLTGHHRYTAELLLGSM